MHDDQRRVSFGAALRKLRMALGRTQAEVAERIGRSQAFVSAVERGQATSLTVFDAERLCRALDATFVFGMEAPHLLGGGRQVDAAHAPCLAYAGRRLRSWGWLTEREVEIGRATRPGWIDLLAFHPLTRVLLVNEIKSEVLDVGEVERQLGWYEREAVAAARRLGWSPATVIGCLLVLATDANDRQMRANQQAFAGAFPMAARALSEVLAGGAPPDGPRRCIAMIDPSSKARRWCRPTVLDGRRSTAPYRNYADFVRAMSARRARRRRTLSES